MMQRRFHRDETGQGLIESVLASGISILIYKDAATASGLLPAGTAIRRPADTNGTGLEMRYLVRR